MHTTNPADLPASRKYLIFGVMAFGQFMALLDIQIVAASLNDVQAGLSAAPDEISWVQTGYLMAELVMIPLSAFLAQALSTRWLFTLSAGLFTISSALCGLAWNIESMITVPHHPGIRRRRDGAHGVRHRLRALHRQAARRDPAILGAVSVLAPTLGPTVGGLAHRRRRLALDLLHQHHPRHRRDDPVRVAHPCGRREPRRCSSASTTRT